LTIFAVSAGIRASEGESALALGLGPGRHNHDHNNPAKGAKHIGEEG
jgi:hypothetical protein